MVPYAERADQGRVREPEVPRLPNDRHSERRTVQGIHGGRRRRLLTRLRGAVAEEQAGVRKLLHPEPGGFFAGEGYMYKTIMAPTEGSDSEKAAISLAVRLAQRFDAELHLARVEPAPLVIETKARTPKLITEQELLDERRASLDKLEA